MWDKGSFGIWLGSYADILFDELAKKTATDFIRSKIRERGNESKSVDFVSTSMFLVHG